MMHVDSMAVYSGFEHKFYVNVWERKQDCLWKLNFEVWRYFNLFFYSVLLIFVWWQRNLSKGELARLLMNQVLMRIWQLFILAIDGR